MRTFVEPRDQGTAQPRDREAGQVILEYLLMIVVTVAIVGIISTGFRKSLFSLWKKLDREVAAACAGCPTIQR